MNILITGITGLLGKYLVETSKASDDLSGVYLGNYQMQDAKNLKYYNLDVQDKNALKKLFKDNVIEIVIHAAGIADVDFCERHYKIAYRSNVLGTQNIIKLCKMHKTKLVYISTNAVFDGENPPYKEEDKVNPINKYGLIKLECEKRVKEAFEKYIIIRPILLYGWNHRRERKNLVTFLLEKLSGAGVVNMVTDIYDNPLFSYHCAQAIWSILEKGRYGIYHIAGKDIVNRYDYALMVADIYGLDRSLIRPVKNSFFNGIAPRPKNTSYDTSKLQKEIGFLPLGLRQGLQMMKDAREGC